MIILFLNKHSIMLSIDMHFDNLFLLLESLDYCFSPYKQCDNFQTMRKASSPPKSKSSTSRQLTLRTGNKHPSEIIISLKSNTDLLMVLSSKH